MTEQDQDEIARLRQVAKRFRHRAEADPGALFPAHADALLRLGSLLAERGEYEDALAASQEGASLYALLAEVQPAAFSASLAQAWNNLSNRLSEAGQDDSALQVAEDALLVARRAQAASPDHHRFTLVSSLINLAGRHLRSGRAEECLNQLAEAAEVFREGGAAGTPFLGPMIDALHRAAMAFAQIGLWAQAIDTRRLLVGLFAEGPPPAMVQLLTLTLQQAAMALAEADGEEEASRRWAEEAVKLAGLLVERDAEEYRLLLAQALGVQARCRFRDGEDDAALDAALEAVQRFQKAVEADPAGAVPSLILTLGTLSAILAQKGMTDQAAIVESQRQELRATLDRLMRDVEA